MEKQYWKENTLQKESQYITDDYIPIWARTLIDLYISPLKYEVMYKMGNLDSRRENKKTLKSFCSKYTE